jgi:hypothetical protein
MAENQRAPAWGDPKADLEALAPQERRRWVLRYAIEPALAELPPMPSPRWAKVMLLAIAGVESGCLYRRQMGDGPARGLWQFERGGGVAGVLQHPATASHAAAALRRRQVPAASGEAWRALERDDALAAVFARLLLLSDPAPLPSNLITGREIYMRTWRPGKPSSPAKWADCWWMAELAVDAAA